MPRKSTLVLRGVGHKGGGCDAGRSHRSMRDNVPSGWADEIHCFRSHMC